MVKNKRELRSAETLAWLKSMNSKLKREKRQRSIDELDRMADIDLHEMYVEVGRLKSELLDKTQEKILTC